MKIKLKERFCDYLKYLKVVTELQQMSDRDLEDIGICRVDIQEFAWSVVKNENVH